MWPVVRISALMILLAATPARAAVTETVRQAPYLVTASTEEEARAAINEKRPGQYDALTKWWIEWRFERNWANGACAITHVHTTLTVTFVEPRLETNVPALRKSFDDYMSKLRTHEQGHAELARATAQQIDTKLLGLAAASCEEVSRQANEMGHALIRAGNLEQAAYDKRTDHGATQGARWPRLPPAPDRSQYQSADQR